MNKRHIYVYQHCLVGKGGGEHMIGTWILNHTCHFVHIHLDSECIIINRACVPMSFVQDWRSDHFNFFFWYWLYFHYLPDGHTQQCSLLWHHISQTPHVGLSLLCTSWVQTLPNIYSLQDCPLQIKSISMKSVHFNVNFFIIYVRQKMIMNK